MRQCVHCVGDRVSLYPDWTTKLEELTGLNTGYRACGILAPVYEEAGSREKEQGTGEGEISLSPFPLLPCLNPRLLVK